MESVEIPEKISEGAREEISVPIPEGTAGKKSLAERVS